MSFDPFALCRDVRVFRGSPVRFARGRQIVGVWLSFLAYSLLRAPIPAVNEPHYLAKARHFWRPDWCAGDLFLESANPHVVFYATFGWLAAAFSLEIAALLGRLISLLLLAIGWDRLVSRLIPDPWGPQAAAWVFLLLQSCGNFAGEWLVGGVESKVVAYALVLWGCGALLSGQTVRGGALLGAAVSFHPVVGAWCVLCLIGAVAWQALSGAWGRGGAGRSSGRPAAERTATWRSYAAAVACGFAISLPGLIPAVAMLSSADPATALRADIIQVAIRLDHHLDPYMFPVPAYTYYAGMVIVWWSLRRFVPPALAGRWLTAFTWMAIAVAIAGWLAAAGPRPITHLPWLTWRIKLLKLYPFRIADLVVPFTLAVTLAALVAARVAPLPTRRRWALVAGGFVSAFLAALLWPGIDKNPSRMPRPVRADWIAALTWVAAETPRECLLWTPDEDWAVKWFAERPEYVNFKDCPQDAAGIVEWYERRVRLAEWKRDAGSDGLFTAPELAEIGERTGITHVVLSRMGPIEPEPVYTNASFRVFDLREMPTAITP